MGGQALFFLISSILGGLALFLFGMGLMTESMREAAGSRLRTILARATGNRLSGISLGTVGGFLIHSSAATVMLVGFVNAGLMTLGQSIPAMLGANIGTTLSMQLISFKLDKYCFFAIALGFALQMLSSRPKVKQIGKMLLGFGMLFLGMTVMKEAIQPYRDVLKPILTHVDGSHLSGMLLGVCIATLFTGVIQSSGATIGMCYALISAGAFTSLAQVYPIVLGAHIGTCATALLGSIGTSIEARRCAFSHLFFNITNVLIALIASPLFLWLIPMTSSDLIHQTANLHTIVIITAAFLILPITPLFARMVEAVIRSKALPPEPSYLDEALLDRPEQAIVAVIKELQRLTRICKESFHLSREIIILEFSDPTIQKIKRNENIIDEIKIVLEEYLTAMTARYLSRRQSMFIQYLNLCVVNVERIGDHIDAIVDLSIKRAKTPNALFSIENLKRLFELHQMVNHILQLVLDSLDAENQNFSQTAEAILDARNEYVEKSFDMYTSMTLLVTEKKVAPIAGMFFGEYINEFHRIVRHAKLIALLEKQPQFWIKRKKLDRVVDKAPEYSQPTLIIPKDFIEELEKEQNS